MKAMGLGFRAVALGLFLICLFLLYLAWGAALLPFDEAFFLSIFILGVCALLVYADQ